MPLELLQDLATQTLPRVIDDPADVDKLRILRAAGYVNAEMPSPAPGSAAGQARVLGITARGQAWLEAHARGLTTSHPAA